MRDKIQNILFGIKKKKILDYSLMVTPKLLLGKVKVILNGLR